MKRLICLLLCICGLLSCLAARTETHCGEALEPLLAGTVIVGNGENGDKIPGISLLAFSELAYRDWTVGKTVYESLESQWNDEMFPDDVDMIQHPSYRDLCQDIADWTVIRTPKSPVLLSYLSAGFYAVAFQEPQSRGGRTVIAYRGSTMQSYEDIEDDWLKNDFAFQIFHAYSGQMEQAQSFYEACVRDLKLDIEKVTVTGHSLGGALATVVSMRNGVDCGVFNSASVYEALAYNKPMEISEHFCGMDRLNMLSFVIEGDMISNWGDEYKHVPHISYRPTRSIKYGYSNTTDLNVTKNHLLSSFLCRNDYDGSFQLPNIIADMSAPTAVEPDDLALFLGTSGDDYVVRQPVKKHGKEEKRAVLLGGDGDDTLISACTTVDILCGGNSTYFDFLDGGEGDDVYYYYKGNGTQIIQNNSGDDKVFLFGFSKDDTLEYFEEESFDVVTCNGIPIIYISGTHGEGATMTVIAKQDASENDIMYAVVELCQKNTHYTAPNMSMDELKEMIKKGSGTNEENAGVRDSGTCGDGVTWVLDKAGKLTISGFGAMDNYSSTSQIPWNKYGWDSTDNDDITSIVIEPGVTNIGDIAFFSCSGAASVQIPETVTRIGGSAFMGCIRLKEVTIPASVKEIGASAFWNCQALEQVKFMQGVEAIGDYAFFGCCLTSAELPASVRSIGISAFGAVERATLRDITVRNPFCYIYDTGFGECLGNSQYTVVHGPADSRAQDYAESYGYTFVAESFPEEVPSIQSDCARAYLSALEKCTDSNDLYANEHFAQGTLYDVDSDGKPEMVLSYPKYTDGGWGWYYAYSVYDFENGSLVPLIENVVTDASSAAAGGSGYAGIALYEGIPVMVVYGESGETSGGGDFMPKRNCEAEIREFSSLGAVETLAVKNSGMENRYYISGREVTEAVFTKELHKFTFLTSRSNADGSWYSLINTIDYIKYGQLKEYLEQRI